MITKIVGYVGVVWFFLASAIFGYFVVSTAAYSPWMIAFSAFIGWLAADFATGLVHWFGDRFFSNDTPVLGELFVFPFREHHTLPKKMTEHDFFELCGTSGVGVGAMFTITHLVRGPQSDLISYSILFFGLFTFLTNQFHRWAHEEKVGPVVKFLQNAGIILSPVSHEEHHKKYDKYYCVTHGHLNPILMKLHFFEALEKCLFFLPHVDDAHHHADSGDQQNNNSAA